jgi:hypothetical protein
LISSIYHSSFATITSDLHQKTYDRIIAMQSVSCKLLSPVSYLISYNFFINMPYLIGFCCLFREINDLFKDNDYLSLNIIIAYVVLQDAFKIIEDSYD